MKKAAAGLDNEGQFWGHKEMREAIVWTMEALDRHVRDGKSPFATDGPWMMAIRQNDAGKGTVDDPAYHAEPETDRSLRRRAQLRTHEVEQMNRRLKWIEALPLAREDGLGVSPRQLVAVVGILVGRDGPHINWADVRHRLGHVAYSNDALRMQHSRAITRICHLLNH